uniref:Uncharacterized protein n=1 Tax=Trichogramma kaykai TaxID=54128 RepID=A0ABD2W9H7_9HYME
MHHKDEAIKIKRAKLTLAENARRDAQRRNALERRKKLVEKPPRFCTHGEIIVNENTCRICVNNVLKFKIPKLTLKLNVGKN